MRKMYQRKHQVLLRSIDEYMDTRVKIVGEKSGLHILIKLKGIRASELIERGLAKGVKVYSPERFWLNPTPEDHSFIMLGFGGLSIEEIEKGIKLLAGCLPGTGDR
jgi:GntR family transcriptional regulator / MocR family aminotransferase